MQTDQPEQPTAGRAPAEWAYIFPCNCGCSGKRIRPGISVVQYEGGLKFTVRGHGKQHLAVITMSEEVAASFLEVATASLLLPEEPVQNRGSKGWGWGWPWPRRK
jgi:hypothetical protein